MGSRGAPTPLAAATLAVTALISLAVIAGTATSPVHAASLEAPPIDLVPGLEKARASKLAGVRALARYLPARLDRSARSARSDATAAVGGGQRVQVTLLEPSARKLARQMVKGWGKGARRDRAKPRRARVGKGGWLTSRRATATVVWWGRSGLGVVQVRDRAGPSPAALAYAGYVDQWVSAIPPATSWDRVMEGIRENGTLSRQTAMQAFAVAHRGLPGVRIPKGPPGAASASLASDWIQRYYRSLSRRQQRVVDRKLGIRRSVAGTRAPFNPATGDKTFTHDPAIEAEVHKYIFQVYYPLIGGPVDVFDVVAGRSNAKPGSIADAGAFDSNGDTAKDLWGIPLNQPIPGMQTCRVRVFPKWDKLPPDEKANVLAHEAFHCVQNALAGPQVWKPKQPWLKEGTAEWAAGEVAPIPYDNPIDAFTALKKYVENEKPLIPVFQMSYHAVGLFGHLEDALLGGYWPNVRKTFQAPLDQPDVVFHAAGAADPPAYDSWASSRFRIPVPGPTAKDWTMESPILPKFAMPTYDAVKPGVLKKLPEDGGVGHLTANHHSVANGLIEEVPGDPIVVVSTNSHARVLSAFGADETVPEGGLWLCAQGICECPAGTTGQVPTTKPWAFPSALALRGPGGATVQTRSLADYCQPEPPGSGDPLDCSGGGCGSSNGDPHLVTLDGRPYDFQAAGEFTLVRSRSGDLEIQARQEPARTLGGLNRLLSLNTAFAMRVGGSRVSVEAARKGMDVRVRGKRVKTPGEGETVALGGGGGALAGRADQLAVIWPDGSEARVWSVGKYGVAIMILPAPSRAGDLVGLLGNFDGNPDNDFATRSGKPLAPDAVLGPGKAAFKRLYGTFGNSWRLGQKQSLFDYRRGRDTRDFTIKRFPKRSLSSASLPAGVRERAEEICRAAGVEDPIVLENCILDVGATGIRAFAQDARTLEATAKRSGPWTRLSGATAPGGLRSPSVSATSDRVVAVYHRGDGAVEGASFGVGAGGITGIARTTATEGWSQVGNLFLLPAAGGQLQLFFHGERSVNPDDPLNGAVVIPRQADGVFGAPTRAAEGNRLGLDAATSTPSGEPIWATFDLFRIYIWRGAQNATVHDLDGFADGVPLALARDASGRLWLAWEDYSGPDATAELFMGQLDPESGQPAPGATPQKAPVSGAETFDPARLACAAICRIVFSGPGEGRILSWAPGEATATEVLSAGALTGVLAADAAPGGGIWTAWARIASGGRVEVAAKLGDGSGAGGTPRGLPSPAGRSGFPTGADAVALPGALVIATNWADQDRSITWGAVVPEG